jgi:predicted ArsR family transcriptional regulator
MDAQATSREARKTVKHGSHKRIVLAILKCRGPMSDHRLEYWAERLGVTGSSARGRRAELVKLGNVKPAGVVRLPNGRPAISWRAV